MYVSSVRWARARLEDGKVVADESALLVVLLPKRDGAVHPIVLPHTYQALQYLFFFYLTSSPLHDIASFESILPSLLAMIEV